MRAANALDRLLPGLPDPVLDSQRIFRAALDAFSHPGRSVVVPLELECPAPLEPASAAFFLAMADFETPIWLQEYSAPAAEYLRFHCGAPIAEDPAKARFALATNPATMPGLDRYDPGHPEYPDRSATLLVQVQRGRRGRPITLRGPGVKGTSVLELDGLDTDFWLQWKRNDALFPCGIDVLFTCGNTFCALPRTTKAEG